MQDETITNVAGRRTVTATLILVIAINPAVLHLFLPAMPAITDDLAVSIAVAQLTLSLALIAMSVATLLYGPLSDTFGRRPILLWASAIVIAGSIIAATAQTIEMLIAGRILQACGAAVGPVLARAVVFDIHGDERAGPAMAKIIVGMVVATMTAPALGGLLADHLGWRANFASIGLLAVALWLAVWRFLPETHLNPDRTSIRFERVCRGYLRLLREPRFLGYALQVTFTMAIVYAFMSASPYVMVRMFQRPATEFGIYLLGVAVGYVIGNAVAARFTLSVGRDRMILLGSSLSFAACIVLMALLSAGIWQPWAIFAPAIVAAFASGLSMPNAEAAVVGVVPSLGGSASSLTSCLVLAVSAAFAQAVGATLADTPYPLGVAMSIAAALALAACAWSEAVRRRRPVR